MITLISLIIVAVGVANWFSIGAFQYDFVAGLFGSQANIFSRLIYVIVGIAGVFLAYSVIKNKGKVILKNKTDKELFTFNKKAKVTTESSKEFGDYNKQDENNQYIYNKSNNTESAKEANIDNHIQSKANRINDKNKLSNKNFYTESGKEHYHKNSYHNKDK